MVGIENQGDLFFWDNCLWNIENFQLCTVDLTETLSIQLILIFFHLLLLTPLDLICIFLGFENLFSIVLKSAGFTSDLKKSLCFQKTCLLFPLTVINLIKRRRTVWTFSCIPLCCHGCCLSPNREDNLWSEGCSNDMVVNKAIIAC